MAESELLKLAGVGPKAAKTLDDCGYNTIEKIAKATADEISKLPGIGLATAEKFVQSAKELESAATAPAKKAVAKAAATKPAVKPKAEVSKETIPKPKTVKSTTKPATKTSEPMPSVKKPAVKAPVKKPAVKAPVKKPAVKAPVKKPVAKPKPAAKPKAPAKKPAVKEEKSVYVKTKVSATAQRAIDEAPKLGVIKKKRGSKKPKVVKREQISQTYGIVSSILHDRTGKSSNRSVVLKLHNTEIPLPKYLGRKVTVAFPNSTKRITGVVSKLHGKKLSKDKTVIVRFRQGVSPHILAARATFV
ncbi:MAG: helix-hairpin-helix domain-containing protein [Candidatus Heimdallarchaeaceae archaeon]